jgi:hypothetical protein
VTKVVKFYEWKKEPISLISKIVIYYPKTCKKDVQPTGEVQITQKRSFREALQNKTFLPFFLF